MLAAANALLQLSGNESQQQQVSSYPAAMDELLNATRKRKILDSDDLLYEGVEKTTAEFSMTSSPALYNSHSNNAEFYPESKKNKIVMQVSV